ncbi:hypothetical protein GIB67_008741 [Kingdonia uniflora]|uniref:Pectinesterase inhibitor domain-containing protein n=1 Tax=Kingdonia uniflora TaxID=39325 RepID=A0A7J7P5G7_9MAGN|nr:hypothetical protein GIB67_008741 [Kingdonia uniflora]
MEHFTPIISLSLLFAILNTKTCSAIRLDPQLAKTNTQFIKTSCGVTLYPQLCYDTLSSYSSTIQTSPKLLVNTSLTLTLIEAQSSSSYILKLSKGHGMKPLEVAAVGDCIEEMGDCVEELQKSLDEMTRLRGGPDFDFLLSNMQTWVSAALTNEDTCIDGFNGMNGNVKSKIRSSVVKIAQLTSNSLALINCLSSISP